MRGLCIFAALFGCVSAGSALAAEEPVCASETYDNFMKRRVSTLRADQGEFPSPETVVAIRRLEEDYCLIFARCETKHPSAMAAVFSGCLTATVKPALFGKQPSGSDAEAGRSRRKPPENGR